MDRGPATRRAGRERPKNGSVGAGSGRVGGIVRSAVTAIALGVVVWRIDPAAVLAGLGRAGLPALAAALGVAYLAVLLSAYKWRAVLVGRGVPERLDRLFGLYLVGLFFNNLLPTAIGGDAVRAWSLAARRRETVTEAATQAAGGAVVGTATEASTEAATEAPTEAATVAAAEAAAEAAASVVSERLIAAMALGVTAAAGLLFVERTPRLVALVAAFLVVDVIIAALFMLPGVAERGVAAVLGRGRPGGARLVSQTVRAVRSTLSSPLTLGWVLLLSLAFQALVAVVNVLIFEAIGVSVGLAECLVFTPMIAALTMLPVSLSGHGIREAAYVFFFAQAGVAAPAAFAGSVLFFVVVAVASLPGALLFVLDGKRTAGREAAEVLAT